MRANIKSVLNRMCVHYSRLQQGLVDIEIEIGPGVWNIDLYCLRDEDLHAEVMIQASIRHPQDLCQPDCRDGDMTGPLGRAHSVTQNYSEK